VQAICDAHCRFSYVSIQTPGTTHDSLAFSLCDAYDLLIKSELSATLARLAYYIVVDQAYAVTHTMMGPWPGDNLDANKDTFNYYQSRTRSRRTAACVCAHADVHAHPNPQRGHMRAPNAPQDHNRALVWHPHEALPHP
jgi:hypothetical protein